MRTAFFLIAIAASLLLIGCLQEKELTQVPTLQPSVGGSTATATAIATATASGTASATATATATVTPTPSATVAQGGSCEINTPRGATSFPTGETVSLFIVFTDLPDSIGSGTAKCDDAGSEDPIQITRQGGAVFARKACASYHPASTRSYSITAKAGSASCSKIITVTVSGS